MKQRGSGIKYKEGNHYKTFGNLEVENQLTEIFPLGNKKSGKLNRERRSRTLLHLDRHKHPGVSNNIRVIKLSKPLHYKDYPRIRSNDTFSNPKPLCLNGFQTLLDTALKNISKIKIAIELHNFSLLSLRGYLQ